MALPNSVVKTQLRPGVCLKMLVPNAERAVGDIGKLRDYCLNPKMSLRSQIADMSRLLMRNTEEALELAIVWRH